MNWEQLQKDVEALKNGHDYEHYISRARVTSSAHDLAALALAGKRANDELDMQIRNCPLCKGTGKAVHAHELLSAKDGVRPVESDCKRCRSARDARDAFRKAEENTNE